jgi:hypothetical protein
MTTTNKNTEILTFLESLKLDIDFEYLLRFNEIESYEDLSTAIDENNMFDKEIIYYSHAMEFLSQNDPSLKNSLEIASGLGYTPENLSSEILASILASDMLRNDFYECQTEIEDFFEELNERYNAEEEEEETI